MTQTEEEAPYVRPRAFRKKVYQVIFVLVGLQSLYLTFNHGENPLKEWPADLADHSGYCRVENYPSCREGAWFGILKSRLPGRDSTTVLKEACRDWKDKPDAASQRRIDAADGDLLYLCRMKDPAKIDRSKMKQ